MNSRLLTAVVLSLGVASCGDDVDNAKIQRVTNEAPETEVARIDTISAPAEDDVPTTTAGIAGSGESVYQKACVGCHLSGAVGAPKLGDKAAWEERISRGTDALVRSAISGVPGTAMLARGTCNACSDDEIKAAVVYMVSQSR